MFAAVVFGVSGVWIGCTFNKDVVNIIIQANNTTFLIRLYSLRFDLNASKLSSITI